MAPLAGVARRYHIFIYAIEPSGYLRALRAERIRFFSCFLSSCGTSASFWARDLGAQSSQRCLVTVPKLAAPLLTLVSLKRYGRSRASFLHLSQIPILGSAGSRLRSFLGASLVSSQALLALAFLLGSVTGVFPGLALGCNLACEMIVCQAHVYLPLF